MKKEEYYMIREYNQYSLCKHLNNGMSISVTTIYAKNSGEAESMARKKMNINSIFKRKHKYLVTFYKPSRVRKYICTRTIGSALQFALKKSFKYGVFTIKRLDK
jgi:hypothetical protein